MKKVYVQPELELLKLSASNEFLVGSPDDGIEGPEANDSWLEGGNGDGYGDPDIWA